ncbi:hypothetical protein SLE2022_143840 [Rubroshorea leprosula]
MTNHCWSTMEQQDCHKKNQMDYTGTRIEDFGAIRIDAELLHGKEGCTMLRSNGLGDSWNGEVGAWIQ